MNDPQTVQLYRPNVRVEPTTIGEKAWGIVKLGILAGLGYGIVAVLFL